MKHFMLAGLITCLSSFSLLAQESFQGELIHVIEDFEKTHKEYQILRDSKSGKIKRLEHIPQHVKEKLESLPSGSKITVRGKKKDGAIAADSVTTQKFQTAEDLIFQPYVNGPGQRSVLSIAVSFKGTAPACQTEEKITEMTMDENYPLSMKNFYKTVSEGNFTLSGESASVNLNLEISQLASCDSNSWADMADEALRAQGIDPMSFDHNMYFLPSSVPCGWGGVAYMGSNRSWVKNCNHKTISHELGHNFGLHHAGAGSNPYGDRSDTMGGSFKEFNAPKREKLGFVSSARVKLLTLGQSYQLAPLNEDSSARSIPQILKVESTSLPGQFFYFSYRNQEGDFDSDLSTTYNNKLNVHLFDKSKSYAISNFMAAIDPGQSFPLGELGGYLKVDSLENGVMNVTFQEGESTDCIEMPPTMKYIAGPTSAEQGSSYNASIQLTNNSPTTCEPMAFNVIRYLYNPSNTSDGLSFANDINSGFLVNPGETYSYEFTVNISNQAELGRSRASHYFSSASSNGYLGYSHYFTVTEGTNTGGDYQAPSVSITSPTNGSEYYVGANLTIQASASDNVGVKDVKFYANDSLLCTDISAPYSCPMTMISGSVAIKAIASDDAGNQSTSSISIQSKTQPVDTQAPSVAITSPSNGAEFEAGSNVIIQVSASDNEAVSAVKFYANSSLICSDSVAPYSCSLSMPSTSVIIKATASDAAGNEASASISIKNKVTIVDTEAPTAPGNLSAAKKGKHNVVLSFSAARDNVAVVEYRIYKNGSLLASTTSTSFTDSKVSGTNSYYVVAKDAAGNTSAQSNSASITISGGSDGGSGGPDNPNKGKGKNK